MLHGNIFQTQTLEQKEHFSPHIDFAFYVLKHRSKVLLYTKKTSLVPGKQLVSFNII